MKNADQKKKKLDDFIYIKFYKMQVNLEWPKAADQWLHGDSEKKDWYG